MHHAGLVGRPRAGRPGAVQHCTLLQTAVDTDTLAPDPRAQCAYVCNTCICIAGRRPGTVAGESHRTAAATATAAAIGRAQAAAGRAGAGPCKAQATVRTDANGLPCALPLLLAACCLLLSFFRGAAPCFFARRGRLF